jgi:hypothetical protein
VSVIEKNLLALATVTLYGRLSCSFDLRSRAFPVSAFSTPNNLRAEFSPVTSDAVTFQSALCRSMNTAPRLSWFSGCVGRRVAGKPLLFYSRYLFFCKVSLESSCHPELANPRNDDDDIVFF